MSWHNDKHWADKLMPDIKAVLGQHLLGDASREDDEKHATDLVTLHMKDLRIAVRMRRRKYSENEHYVGQFTIRTERSSGMKTELAKVIEGWGDYYFYGFEGQEDGRLGIWHLIDLKQFRLGYMRLLVECERGNCPGETIKNADGKSTGCAFSYEWFSTDLVIASGIGVDGVPLVAQEAF
jgi:hypothetical protein